MESTNNEDEPRRIARDFWVQQATSKSGALAVNPGGRWQRYHGATRRMLQTWTLERLRVMKPRYHRCVDIGCGFGDWTEPFATISDEVFGCEIAPGFVEQARQRVPGASIACSDLQSYAIPAESDLLYLGAVVMYVPDNDAVDVLRRIHDALVPGGVLAWREYCTFNLGRRTVNQSEERYSVHRTPREICTLGREAGLQLVEARSAPSIYGEVIGGRIAQWPLRGLMRVATLGWRRASHTFLFRR